MNVESGGKMQKTNAALGGKMQKTPLSSEKTTFFTLGKDEAICQFRIRQQRIRLAFYHQTKGVGIKRRVRDFSSAKHQRTQPMKNVLGVF